MPSPYELYPTEEEIPQQGIVLKRALGRRTSAGDTLTNNVTTGRALPNSIDALRTKASEFYKQGSDLYNSDPDMTQLQEFAKQRGQQGDRSMLTALAAQFAGEGYAPVQEQMLKKAAASSEPMKFGAGMLTPEGNYIKDPFAAQDKRAEFLLQQARMYEQLAATAETTREKIEAQRAQQEVMNQMRMMGLNIQQQGLNLRRDLAANKEPDHSKTWRAEDNLRGDFDKMTKDLREELNATGKIMQIVSATPPGQKPDAITQQSLVILLNKFLDPGSVVREGEFDRVVKAQGLIGQAQNISDRILKGQPLDANTIKQINGLANLYSQAASQKIQYHADNYADIAGKRNLDVGSVISDPKFRRQTNGAAGSAPAGIDQSLWNVMTPEERALWQKK